MEANEKQALLDELCGYPVLRAKLVVFRRESEALAYRSPGPRGFEYHSGGAIGYSSTECAALSWLEAIQPGGKWHDAWQVLKNIACFWWSLDTDEDRQTVTKLLGAAHQLYLAEEGDDEALFKQSQAIKKDPHITRTALKRRYPTAVDKAARTLKRRQLDFPERLLERYQQVCTTPFARCRTCIRAGRCPFEPRKNVAPYHKLEMDSGEVYASEDHEPDLAA